MFGELPKLFDRNFAMAYFLPVAVFFGLLAEIANRHGQGVTLSVLLQINLIIGATLFVLISWLGAVFLLVTNRWLYRIFEGYGEWNPLKVLKRFEVQRYKKLEREIYELDDQFRECLKDGQSLPAGLIPKRSRLMEEMVNRFPDDESLLLPTPFGNTVRAFEVYPRVMYGFGSIEGWSRLIAVIPKEYRELLDNAKTNVDLWINISLLSFILLIEYFVFAISSKNFSQVWIAVIILIVLGFSPYFAQISAGEWGNYVKGAFDVFTPKLRVVLNMPPPVDRKDEMEQWNLFSQAILYRLPKCIPELDQDQSSTQE